MLYLIGGVALVIVTLYVGLKTEQAGKAAAQAQYREAASANKSLEADCKSKIRNLGQEIFDRAKADKARADASKAALAKAKAKAAAGQGVINRDLATAKDTTAISKEQACADAEVILREYAKGAQ